MSKTPTNAVIMRAYVAVLITLIITITGYAVTHKRMIAQAQPDYQLKLTMDSIYVYNCDRYLGACAYGKDGVDSVLLKDNE